ncbi:MAG: transglycosylase SLT domain-containing protein [Mycobacteriaceae bacterium]|nr:transglycosylase SLT domain-containing protein [Mycobacteriaceae bacterium]
MPPSQLAVAPTGPVAWTGSFGAGYRDSAGGASHRASALHGIEQKLRKLLGDSAESAQLGRARVEGVIAEVKARLAALGPVSGASGRDLALAAVAEALRRGGLIVREHATGATESTAAVAELVTGYVADAAEVPVARSGGPAGAVGGWIDQALGVLAEAGHDTSRIDPAAVAAIIEHESSGDPYAINLWDSNAANGIPSKGLMQTIDPTFRAHALPGHGDIWNPVDNIIAGVRYAESRYGSVDNVPGVRRLDSGGGYVGY